MRKNERGITVIELLLLIVIICVGVIILKNVNKTYDNPNIDKESEWYVNDLYMSDQYYYNNVLNEEQKKYYKIYLGNIKNHIEEFSASLPLESVLTIMHAISLDHPELINYTTFSYQNNGSSVLIGLRYFASADKEKGMITKVQRKIADIVDATKGKNDYEKELYVYEWLAKKTRYGSSLVGNGDQTAYTAFNEINNTVCAGYAKAAQIIFQNIGLKSHLIISDIHMWNVVNIE